jgi:hypothetical protein
MKNNITIKMGASRWDVIVNTPTGPVTFDLYRMTRERRAHFFSEFRRAVRKHMRSK